MKAETDHLLSEIFGLSSKAQRHIFMTMWRDSDGLNEGLSADDCIEIFNTALKGSSDFDYELLAQTCGDYGVPTENESFVLLARESYDKLVSDCLTGQNADGAELDTEALANLLRLKNTGQVEVFLLDVAQKERFLLDFDGKYIYLLDKNGKETPLSADVFEQIYAGRQWKIETVFHR